MLSVAELWFLCITLLYNMFYQCMKFQVDRAISRAITQKTKAPHVGANDRLLGT